MCDFKTDLNKTEILRWALANRRCKITEVPHKVIMTLMEDIIYSGCSLVEDLVMALDDSQGTIMDHTYLERAAEKLMTNVLLASLYEDGYIDIAPGSLHEPYLFDFGHNLDVRINLTPSGEESGVWEELHLFRPTSQAVFR